MTLDLEALAIRRADEQLAAGAWRDNDPGETRQRKPTGKSCHVCSAEFPTTRGNALLCPSCRDAGLSSVPCKGCGGVTRHNDVRGVQNRERRGYCQTCRASMPKIERGAETLVIARAVTAARRAAERSAP